MRLVSIKHGFPFIYHPDEPTVVRSALGIRFDPNPHHFDWPHLYFYLNYFIYMVFAKVRDLLGLIGLKTALSQVFPLLWNDNLVFYLVSRVFSALLGGLTVIPLYLWVKKLVSKGSGLLSAGFLSVAPFHVRHSHYALIDVPMLFFLTWSLFFATFSPVLSGLFLGFSASTKYNGVLGAVFIVMYYLLTKRRLVDYIITGAFTILGFLIGTPFALFDFKTFIRTDGPQGALWQFTNFGKADFSTQIAQFTNALTLKLPTDLGYGVVVLTAASIVFILIKLFKRNVTNRYLILCIGLFILLTFYVSGLEKNRSHYYMVVYPYVFLTAGWMLWTFSNKLKTGLYKIAMFALVFTPSIILSVITITDLVNKKSDTIYGGDKIIQNETTKQT